MVGGDYTSAIPVLRQAVAAAPQASLTYAYALYDLGRSLRLAGDPRAAVHVLYRRLQIPNQTDVVRNELTLALDALGQSQTGITGTGNTQAGHAGGGNANGGNAGAGNAGAGNAGAGKTGAGNTATGGAAPQPKKGHGAGQPGGSDAHQAGPTASAQAFFIPASGSGD
jgi:hypothetical protein